jgi:hypothetical protein
MKETRFKPWLCFACGHKCDAASSILGDHVPSEGDLSACINCTVPSILRNGTWTLARSEDLARLDPEERRDLLKHQWAIEEMHRVMGKPGGGGQGRA